MTTHIVAGDCTAAGCAQLPRTPSACPQCPPPKPGAGNRALRKAVPFADLPGMEPRLDGAEPCARLPPACRRFGRLCELAASVPADDERARGEFFEAEFQPLCADLVPRRGTRP